MKLFAKTLSFIAFILFFSNCASIVSKSNWPLTVNTNPNGAKLEIADKKGITIFEGVTPATISLKSSSGFFSKESYSLKFTLDGYEPKIIPVRCKVNGWYWGNIVFGGLIGWLIVDPATGAMYKLDTEYVNETMMKKDNQTQASLEIRDINQVPVTMRQHLIKID